MTEGLYKCDAEWLSRATESDSVDLIWTDPPFGSGKMHKVSTAPKEAYRDLPAAEAVDLLSRCASHWARILRPTGVACICLDNTIVHEAAVEFKKVLEPKGEIIWHFEGGGIAKKWWSNKHNTILIFVRKDATDIKFHQDKVPSTLRKAKKPGYEQKTKRLASVWNYSFSTMDPERAQYPSQKPTALITPFIEVHTDIGDVVFDPFCGSGSTGVAAQALGRKYILGDINAGAIQVADQRLQM